MESEVWLPIPNYEGLYEVSNFGRIISHKSGKPKLLKGGPGTCPMRYRRVTLRDTNGCPSVRYIHIVVLETFIGPRPAGMWGLHDDGVVENCRLDNLHWGTPAENSADRVRHGRTFVGEHNPNQRLTHREVAAIRAAYRGRAVRQRDLARRFGVSQAHISRIILKASWS